METETENNKRPEMRSVGQWELLTLMVDEFGSRRAAELMGWAVRWSMTGEVENVEAARRLLLEKGLSRSSVYRALTDIRHLRDMIDETEGRKVSMVEFFVKLGLDVAGVSDKTPPVVQSKPTAL